MQDGSWTEYDMALLTPNVRVSNTWSRSTRAEYGHIFYEMAYEYRVGFTDHTRYLMKHGVRVLDRPFLPWALHFGRAHAAAPIEDAEVPVKNASVVPLDVTSGGTESGSESISQESSVASGQGSVPRSVHKGAVHTLGVTMVMRSSVARRTNIASPAPPPSMGEMVNVMGRALQSTMASL
jgi:hypothetical protein